MIISSRDGRFAAGITSAKIGFGAPIFSTASPVGGKRGGGAAAAAPPSGVSGRIASCSISVMWPSTIFRRTAIATNVPSVVALAALAHGADERDLLRLDVGHVELVRALAGHPEPQSFVAEREPNAVLRELGLARKQLGANRVRLHRVEVAIDEAVKHARSHATGGGGLRERG